MTLKKIVFTHFIMSLTPTACEYPCCTTITCKAAAGVLWKEDHLHYIHGNRLCEACKKKLRKFLQEDIPAPGRVDMSGKPPTFIVAQLTQTILKRSDAILLAICYGNLLKAMDIKISSNTKKYHNHTLIPSNAVPRALLFTNPRPRYYPHGYSDLQTANQLVSLKTLPPKQDAPFSQIDVYEKKKVNERCKGAVKCGNCGWMMRHKTSSGTKISWGKGKFNMRAYECDNCPQEKNKEACINATRMLHEYRISKQHPGTMIPIPTTITYRLCCRADYDKEDYDPDFQEIILHERGQYKKRASE